MGKKAQLHECFAFYLACWHENSLHATRDFTWHENTPPQSTLQGRFLAPCQHARHATKHLKGFAFWAIFGSLHNLVFNGFAGLFCRGGDIQQCEY